MYASFITIKTAEGSMNAFKNVQVMNKQIIRMKIDHYNLLRGISICLALLMGGCALAQQAGLDKQPLVNVFLGSSGDHGQLSPAASYPFSMLSIGPQTNPTTHMGYEYFAKEFLGFTHNRFEGVGCQGSGGLLLVKPFLGDTDDEKPLMKVADQAEPGYYAVSFTNGIQASFTVNQQGGVHHYHFPKGKKGIRIDLGYCINRTFVDEYHQLEDQTLSGWIKGKTVCHAGVYQWFYHLAFSGPVKLTPLSKHEVLVFPADEVEDLEVYVGTSTVGASYAVKATPKQKGIASAKQSSATDWNQLLGQIVVKGEKERTQLFYSLLYRTLQSPYLISEPDGTFRGVDGKTDQANGKRYHGWAVWDNYKTQLPLLSLAYPAIYGDIVQSLAGLYAHGKHDFAGQTEPSNTVRTEHTEVVLLDAYRKGYAVNFEAIKDSLLLEATRFNFSKPDRALESAYDLWALSHIFDVLKDKQRSDSLMQRAAEYQTVWNREFKDLSKGDVDRMSARGMYQGTIRQYRWAVPFDMKGLVDLAGGKAAFTEQLDDFFDNHYFNRANEPDMQSQLLYYASDKPWKYQWLTHHLALDTVIQYYFNDNSRGTGAFIDRIYKNEPKAYIRTMDDDAGAMSGWFVLTAIGLQPACVGEPIYYLNVPLFPEIVLKNNGKPFVIRVKNFGDRRPYIKGIQLNGKSLDRVWLKHDEIARGGTLVVEASETPKEFGKGKMWVSSF